MQVACAEPWAEVRGASFTERGRKTYYSSWALEINSPAPPDFLLLPQNNPTPGPPGPQSLICAVWALDQLHVRSGVERAKEKDEGTQKGGVGEARLLCDHIQEGAITSWARRQLSQSTKKPLNCQVSLQCVEWLQSLSVMFLCKNATLNSLIIHLREKT